jgi:multicomponent K+:H+ antiporter subunit E
VLFKFLALVLWDIVIANLILAMRILGPQSRLQPAFMQVPLDIQEEFTITLLASTISLTPGTVSADLNMEGRYLLVHSLHVTDIDAAIAAIKQRYETPLKEVFECSLPR